MPIMKKRKRCCILALIVLVTLAAGVLVYLNFIPILEYFAENWLVVSDPLRESDVIIVITGGFEGERLEQAIELFQNGYAKKMIFSGTLLTKDISIVDLWLTTVEKSGISSEDIFLHRDAESTHENAVFAANVMQQHGYKHALLVTSPYHSRRAKRVFKKVLGSKGYDLAVVPVRRPKKLPEEEPGRRTDIVIKEIILEIQKTIYYWIAY